MKLTTSRTTNRTTNRTIWVDLDGVLCDWIQGYVNIFGGDPTIKWVGMNKVKWDKLDSAAPHFYRNLPLMPGALELWEWLLPFEPCILSAASSHIPASASQKHEWVKEYLGIEGDRIVIVADREDKPRYCNPGDILIDDLESNVNEWNVEGGYGIMFHSAEQTIAELEKMVIDGKL